MSENTDFASRAASTAKERSQQMLEAAQQRSREIAGNAQRYVQENPFRAISYTSAALFGLGIIIGRLLAPDRYAASDLASAADRGTQDMTRAAQERSQEWIDTAKEKSQQLLAAAQQRSRDLIDTTQEYVEEYPARAATYAGLALLAVAALVGYMASGESDRDPDQM